MASKRIRLWPKTETDLADVLVPWLKERGWEVYQEVQIYRGSGRADIVAVQRPLVWVIELKQNFSLSVLDQACHWRHHAHYSSIAVPPVNWRGCRHARELCQALRIGMLELRKLGPYDLKWAETVHERVAPYFHRRAKYKDILESLCEEQKDFAKAGNANGEFWTPFKGTCKALAEYVEKNPGQTMKEVIDRIDHHYASAAGARAHLAKYIERGIVANVLIKRDERNRIRLYPAKH